MTNLSRTGDVFVLDLGDTENRFHPDWLAAVDDALTEVEKAEGPKALVTSATGKFWSNGLDLDWLGQNADQFEPYVAKVQSLLARLLVLPVPTATAINGHAFGAGAMLAMTLDWRVMREDRGFFCFPEVDIQIPFTPGMAALIQAKLTPRAATDSMTTGRRFPGPDALAAGIVDGTAPEAELVEQTIARVAPLAGKSADTLGKIKSTMYATAVAALTS